MSKYSLKNILLGFGIGLVFVSMINLNAGQKKMTVDDIKKEAEKYNLIVLDQQDMINKQAQDQNKSAATPAPTTTPAPAKTPAPTATPTPTPVQGIDVTITIPEGKTSEGIANILSDSGLIKDKKLFLDRLDGLGRASRLHSGKFTIRKGTDIDDIIYILAK